MMSLKASTCARITCPHRTGSPDLIASMIGRWASGIDLNSDVYASRFFAVTKVRASIIIEFQVSTRTPLPEASMMMR